MPDSKITALTALTAADPAVDMFPVVDVSDTTMAASGTTKRISINNILACSPAATLASLNVTGSSIPANGLYLPTTNTLEFAANSLAQYRIAPLGVFSWYDGAGGTRMTLNSSGLGVGVGPTYKLQSVGIAAATSSTVNGSGGNLIGALLNSDDANSGVNPGVDLRRWTGTALNHGTTYIATNATGDTLFYNGSVASNTRATSLKMTLDASGRMYVGTTSSGGVNGFSIVPDPSIPTCVLNGNATTGGTAYLLYSTGATANRFYVTYAGTVFATNTTISAISDQRLKENVQDIDVGLGAILALKPRKFDWKEGKGKNIKGDRGFIAQEFEQVFPQLVDEWQDKTPEGEAPYKSVRQDLIPVLVKAIQELTARVQTLEAK